MGQSSGSKSVDVNGNLKNGSKKDVISELNNAQRAVSSMHGQNLVQNGNGTSQKQKVQSSVAKGKDEKKGHVKESSAGVSVNAEPLSTMQKSPSQESSSGAMDGSTNLSKNPNGDSKFHVVLPSEGRKAIFSSFETPRQSAIEQRRPIGDLNEVHSGDTEPDVVTDGGVSGGGSSPPDSGAADSKQIAPLVVVDQEGGDSQETTAPIIGGGISPEFRSKSAAPGITTVVDGRVGGGGLSFDLNAEIKSLSSDDDEIEVIDGGDHVGEPNRKRMRYGGGDGGGDGEPSQNLRLFGIDINSIEEEEVGGGGGLPELGFRREEEEGSEDDDDASGGGGGAVVDGGEPPIIQQPIRGGFRLFGHDI
ncbi:hypothetical protein L6452_42987 [Arctium lappa]|uniref:Uncharacterized protein n=1 Tax=Arctium lappa TaxID=4217 RepID=A0ACB8XK12_ARCLA|nr:hypothetical protein L6452_42987 [Arctium lappa]